GKPWEVATWYMPPEIPDTTASDPVPAGWPASLPKPGPVVNAKEGQFQGTKFNLTGGEQPDHNHAKIGVSVEGNMVAFGDMNQDSSQETRGGTFFVVHDDPNDPELVKSVASLLGANAAPAA